ncbi:hypothetical protein [Streptomyces sp. NPDC050422]|uniref:hypothetical protein n=1 Tax=Streptomyces sp. NPDC050422 TaxID=3365614 RepID=UPI003798F051
MVVAVTDNEDELFRPGDVRVGRMRSSLQCANSIGVVESEWTDLPYTAGEFPEELADP